MGGLWQVGPVIRAELRRGKRAAPCRRRITEEPLGRWSGRHRGPSGLASAGRCGAVPGALHGMAGCGGGRRTVAGTATSRPKGPLGRWGRMRRAGL